MIDRLLTRAFALGCVAAVTLGLAASTMPRLASAQDAPQRARPQAASAADSIRNRANAGTIGLISGGVEGTYVRIAADLASVLDSDEVRVLPIIGKGSVQNTLDIMFLRGVDVGIVQSDVLAFLRRERTVANLDRSLQYIAKLYNEELHVLGNAQARALADLNGKKVNFDVRGSGTSITASLLFEKLGIKVEPTYFDQALALEKLRSGEIAAITYVAGRPTRLFRDIRAEEGLRFIPVPATEQLTDTYLPATLASTDYPGLIPNGESVETIAVGAVMAVYGWPAGSDRHARVARFIEAFFSRFPEFLKAPRHAKWKEVNLAARVPGWQRFSSAEQWLQAASTNNSRQQRQLFGQFLDQAAPGATLTPQQRDALFTQFLEWQRTGGAVPTTR